MQQFVNLFRAQYLVHCTAFCEFINELVEISDFLCERIWDILYFISTNCPCYEVSIFIESCFLEKSLKSDFSLYHFLYFFLIITCEPCDDFMKFFFCSSFFLHFHHIVGIDCGKYYFCHFCIMFGCYFHSIIVVLAILSFWRYFCSPTGFLEIFWANVWYSFHLVRIHHYKKFMHLWIFHCLLWVIPHRNLLHSKTWAWFQPFVCYNPRQDCRPKTKQDDRARFYFLFLEVPSLWIVQVNRI